MVWKLKRSFCSLQCVTINCRLESSAHSQQTAAFFPPQAPTLNELFISLFSVCRAPSMFSQHECETDNVHSRECVGGKAELSARFCTASVEGGGIQKLKSGFTMRSETFFSVSICQFPTCSLALKHTHAHIHIVVMQPGGLVHCFSS